MDSLAAHLEPIKVDLKDLFLDPNNPRFVGSDWAYIPDDQAVTEDEQKAAAHRLIAHHDVNKLQLMIQANGFLPIDRVVIRALHNGQYMVLEGNRRICAAKQINGYLDDGSKISSSIMSTLKEIECLLYTGHDEANQASWIFQGLRHISGKAYPLRSGLTISSG